MFYFCITWVYCNLVSVDLTSWFQFLGLIIEVVSYLLTEEMWTRKCHLFCIPGAILVTLALGNWPKVIIWGDHRICALHHPPLRCHAGFQLVDALYGLYLGK